MQLDDRAVLRIHYRDDTPLGSAVTSRCDDVLRESCPHLLELWRGEGIGAVVRDGPRLLEETAARPGELGRYFRDARTLVPEFLRPDPRAVTPVALDVLLDEPRGGHRLALPPALAPELASWIGEWRHRASAPLARGPARELFDALGAIGAWVEPSERARAPLGDVCFVGHACVRFATPDGGGVLVDPWLVPSATDREYRALTLRELAPVRAVLLTHAHPDHYDPGTLLGLGPDVPVIVPRIEGETVLAIDLALRLRELGFRDVRTPAWGERLLISGLEIGVLPFYGEQPAVDDNLHPEIRNAGNTYRIDAGYGRFAVIADSGRDPLGDARRMAREDLARHGPIDVLFAGCRGFGMYPVHYLFSSVARYLPFVPRGEWRMRQRIMNDADDALDVAELWGARTLVPYADGGAPWYWELGLGPVLDGVSTPIAAVDPAPEHALAAALARSGSSRGPIRSPVEVAVLRPGDRWHRGEHGLRRERPVAWPFPPVPGLPRAE